MDRKMHDIRQRMIRIVGKIDAFKAPYQEIIDTIDRLEHRSITKEYALNEIERLFNIIDPPTPIAKKRHLHIVKD